ncbi:MAG: hypothetical protein ACI9VT_001546 [Psychroserpens sp.]|jgi:hypothetical protein
MFKKTLIAATLAAMSTSAMAIDVTGNAGAAQTYSYEGIASTQTKNDGTALTLGADANATVVSLTLGAEYTTGDTITLTLTGAQFKPTETFTLEETAGGGNTITMGFLSATASTLTFRVTAVTGTTAGLILLLDNGTFVQGGATAEANAIILDSVAIGAKASITAAALTGTGLAIDVQGSAKDTMVVATVVQQHKFTVATVDAMAAKIDVAKARQEFSGLGGEEADFAVTYTGAAADQAAFTVDAAGLKYTVQGSMTGFENSIAAASNDGTITAGAGGALTVAADLLSASVAGLGVAGDTFTFAVDATAADRVILNVGSYSVDAEVANAAGNKVTYTGVSAGSHSLNGSTATFAYAPVNYSAITTQFEIGNSGAVDGEVTISGFDTAGTVYSAVLPFLAMAGQLTSISDKDISDAFALTAGTKLRLSFTVNAPNDDITYGGYSNRGTTGRMSLTKEL